MATIEAKKINEEVAGLIDLFVSSDKKLAIIKTNDMVKLYDREEIEQMECEVDQLYKFTETYFLNNILKLQKELIKLEEHKDLLNKVNKLELVIKHFGYKFYGKCRETPKDELFIKGKNAYLDCCKKPFVMRGLDIKDANNNNNELESNKFCKIKINLQTQSLTSEKKLSLQPNRRRITKKIGA